MMVNTQIQWLRNIYTIIVVFFICIFSAHIAYAVTATPKITDKEIVERLTRLEEGQKALNNKINFVRTELNDKIESVKVELKGEISTLRTDMNVQFNRIDSQFNRIDSQFNRIINIFVAIFGGLIVLIIFVIGFAIWDRKTTVKPIEKKEEKIEKVLIEYSKQEPRLASVLRNFGLL